MKKSFSKKVLGVMALASLLSFGQVKAVGLGEELINNIRTTLVAKGCNIANYDFNGLRDDVGAVLVAEDQTTVIHLLAAYGANDELNQILELIPNDEIGTLINVKMKYDDTPLIVAAMHGKFDVVETLLNHGADVHIRNGADETALYHAAGSGSQGIVRLLIDANVDVNAHNAVRYTALHEAVRSGADGIVGMLIDAHADVNADNCFGETALHLAAAADREDIVRMLLDAHADVNVRDFLQKVPQDYAPQGSETMRLLQEAAVVAHNQ